MVDKKREKMDPAIQRVLEVAALKAQVNQAGRQTQSVINTLVKYSEALGRLMQTGRTLVDTFAEVEEKHGACPDGALAAQVEEFRKVVYDLLPKEDRDGGEKQQAAGEGKQGGNPDGGLDAAPAGEAPEGSAADEGAPGQNEAAPQANAPTPQAG